MKFSLPGYRVFTAMAAGELYKMNPLKFIVIRGGLDFLHIDSNEGNAFGRIVFDDRPMRWVFCTTGVLGQHYIIEVLQDIITVCEDLNRDQSLDQS